MSEKTVLYDHLNRPIEVKELERESPSPVSGVRDIWHDSQATNLTPSKLATILGELREGDVSNFLTLADEIEEREPHYSSVIGTRKNALAGLEPMVEAGDSEDIADEVRALVRTPEFTDLIEDLLDALNKGFSVSNMQWEHTSTRWTPRVFKRADQRWFQFDKKTLELRLRDNDVKEGIPLKPYKWIVHYPRLKSGFPVSGGLARVAATGYMCKNYTIKDWMRFIEIYGMPLRVGRYGPNATAQDKAILKRAVINIGADAAAIIPDSMKIEFQNGGNQNAGMALYKGTAEWIDRQFSKVVLGQTASTEGTAGKLGGDDAQDDVRRDILRKDARTTAGSLNVQVIRAFVDLNWGRQENYPIVKWSIKDPEDMKAWTDNVSKMVEKGLRVSQKHVRNKLNLPEPEEGEELLMPPSSPSGPAGALNRREVALNRKEEDDLEAILADALAGAGEIQDETIAPIHTALLACNSFEEMATVLEEMVGDVDVDRFTQRLAMAQLKVRGSADHS